MKRWLLIALALTALAVASAFLANADYFGPLPDPLPTHWNARGEPDHWAPRSQALGWLLLPPGLMGGMILLGLALPWLSPKPFSLETFRSTYEHIMLLIVGLFGYLHVALLLSYLRPDLDGARLLVGGLMVFFAFLGNVMGKVRRNLYVGVRTPWTIASEVVWNRTHRVAAWLWTPGSLVLGVAVLVGVPVLWVLPPFFVMILYPVFYSLCLYKRLERQGKLDLSPPAEGHA